LFSSGFNRPARSGIKERRAGATLAASGRVLLGRISGPIELLARLGPGRVLDIPAGEGAESAELRARGFDVVAAELFPRADRARTYSWVATDANATLPFRDGAFDYVLSREGIEHLEHQAGFVRECSRVIRPGGAIVITTPNLMHLSARMSQFLTGQRSLRRGLSNEVQTLRGGRPGRYYHGHIFLIDYFRLRYLMRLAGFDGIEFHTDRYSPTAVALGWTVPLLYAATGWSVRVAARRFARSGGKAAPDAVIREIRAHVFSRAALFGKRMIIFGRKA
jgi:SAM-dependent methyltransferase